MTLKDIAERANVSVSTVSRVINSPDNSFATEEVRERIWKIVHESGYVLNQAARNLKKNAKNKAKVSSKTISCIFGRTKTPADNPFFAQVARAIEYQSLQMGYVIASSYSAFDIRDKTTLQRILALETDGAIIMGRFENEVRTFLTKHYKNIVYTGLNTISAQWDQVICDGYEAAKTAMQYLIDLGHTRIAYIGETAHEIRYHAYTDALKQNNISFNQTLVSNVPLDANGGYAGAEKLITAVHLMPTAIFCGNDMTAIAAIRKLKEQGIRVPTDISVIGIDNIDISQYVSPLLTTVNIPKEELGKAAVRLLIDRINNTYQLPMKVLLPHQLIVRESVTKV